MTLATALAVTVMADDGVPYEPTGLPGSSLCCPQGRVALCWCAPDVRSVPPCEPPAVLGTVPGQTVETCVVY